MKTRLLIMSILTLFGSSALIVTGTVGADMPSQTKAAVPYLAQQPAPPIREQTVEQTQKNIKILTGMPATQLIPVMEFFETSLGVRCNFCHVNKNGQWDFVSDDKPEKSTARKMIQMVLETNKNLFSGNANVSCYTCHRGRISPQTAPSLPLTGKPRSMSQVLRAQPEPAEILPASDDSLNKYLAALGGQSAIDNLKSRTMKGTIAQLNDGQPVAFQFVFEQVAPDKFHQLVTFGAVNIESGFDGLHGWQKVRNQLREVVGAELADFRARGLFSQIKLKEQFARLRVEGKDKIGDREAYVLTGTTSADRRQRLYFDVQTGLLMRRTFYLPTMIGEIPEMWDFEDYRVVDGIEFPFIIHISSIDSGNPVSTRNITEMKTNITVDESILKMPGPTQATTP